jgi:hypothetical protein
MLIPNGKKAREGPSFIVPVYGMICNVSINFTLAKKQQSARHRGMAE